MSRLDRELLAEKAAVIERHLVRVEERLPADPADFMPSTGAADSVILHLWQATQSAIDLAISACVHLGLGPPPTYADAFRRLAGVGAIPSELGDRLTRAAGFRNLIVHAYEDLEMDRVYRAAREGPADLRRFLAELREYA